MPHDMRRTPSDPRLVSPVSGGSRDSSGLPPDHPRSNLPPFHDRRSGGGGLISPREGGPTSSSGTSMRLISPSESGSGRYSGPPLNGPPRSAVPPPSHHSGGGPGYMDRSLHSTSGESFLSVIQMLL